MKSTINTIERIPSLKRGLGRLIKKTILTSVCLLILTSTFAQTSNKKRVLVIPLNRFEFVSEFDLETIAKKNETTANKVFLTYEKALLASFKGYNDENFEFVPVQAEKLKRYKKLIKYKYSKFNGKKYNGVDLKRFSEKDFTDLLALHNADFVIFITGYKIKKETLRDRMKNTKKTKYAAHYFDYDVYNLFKQKVVGAGRVKAIGKPPTKEETPYMLLRVKELKIAYNNFISTIVKKLNNPINKD